MFPSCNRASFLRIRASLNLHLSCPLEANTVRLLHLAVTICLVALKVLSGHIMKGRIHWTNIASILVCPLIFESPNYINLEQLKVFKGIETVWSWPIPFHFLRDFRAGFLFLFICFGFRGLVKGSGEVKSSSLITNRGALCCFPFWIDKKSYMYSYILFVVCAGQFWWRDCSSERATFHSPCWGWR